jgi:hypothetical protein
MSLRCACKGCMQLFFFVVLCAAWWHVWVRRWSLSLAIFAPLGRTRLTVIRLKLGSQVSMRAGLLTS